MSRTSSSSVQGVLLDDYNGTSSLTPFIDTASAIVDRVATCATEREYTLSTIELELIERWLAAHFYVVSDQPYSSKQTERSKADFQGKTGMYFESSKYGQTAISIDYSGCLASISKRQKATAFWLGKPVSDQIPYEDRD